VHQHGADVSGGLRKKPAKRKPPKGEQSERPNREEHGVWARLVKNFQNVGDVTNDTAGL
jgi:hypothetical protein